MQKSEEKQSNFDQEKLLEFLLRTKEGKMGVVESSSLKYVRIKEATEPVHQVEEDFYYSVGSIY